MPDCMRNRHMRVKNDYARGGLVATCPLMHTSHMNIANLRRLRGLNQNELADLVGITQGAISRAEAGEDGVTLRNYKAIADALRVPLAELFQDDRTKAENEIMDLFRRLPKDRQQVWLEMSRTFSRGLPEPTQQST